MTTVERKLSLDPKELMEAAHSNETAFETSQLLSTRERNRLDVNLRRIRQDLVRKGKKVVDSDFSKYWEDLQKLGAGSITYTRRGTPSRFEFHHALTRLAKMMLTGEPISEEPINEEPGGTPPPFKPTLKSVRPGIKKPANPRKLPSPIFRVAKDITTDAAAVIKEDAKTPLVPTQLVYIPNLRDNFDLRIQLPVDITAKEVSVITRILARLSV